MTKITPIVVQSQAWIRAALCVVTMSFGALSCADKACSSIPPCPAPGFDTNTCECSSPSAQPGAGGDQASTTAACNPLSSETSPVTLLASDVIGAGRNASDGSTYVLTGQNAQLRLFVATEGVLIEQFQRGAGYGQTGSVRSWTFSYDDEQGMPVTVEVAQDANGTRMGVAKGSDLGKGFDVGSVGDTLEPIADDAAAALPAQTTQTFHVEFSAADSNGHSIVVIAPDHAMSFDGFRLFYGPPSALVQQSGAVTVTRGLSIPSTTTIEFTLAGSPATLQFGAGGDLLSIGASSEALTASAASVVPAGAAFLCLQ